MVCDIANTTCMDVAIEEHQHVAIDRRATDGTSLDVASRLKHFPKRRHARLPHEENKAAERNKIARRLRHAVSGWGAISGADHAIASVGPRNETRAIRLTSTLRVNSGTGCDRINADGQPMTSRARRSPPAAERSPVAAASICAARRGT